MKQFWSKYKEVLVIAGFVIGVFVLAYFVARPILKEITTNRDNIQAELLLQESKKNKLASIPVYREQAQRITEEGKKMQVFASKENAIILIEKIEAAAQETDVQISIKINENKQSDVPAKKSASKKDETPKTLVEELPSDKYLQLNVVFAGDFRRITNFLHKIETMEYMDDVTSLQIERVEEKDQDGNQGQMGVIGGENEKKIAPVGALQATMDVVFYLQPE